jgi:ATP adenylyltransferase
LRYSPSVICAGRGRKRSRRCRRSCDLQVGKNSFPVTAGHTLICPKRNFSDLFEAAQDEIDAIWQLAKVRKKQLQSTDGKITGFNFGVNSGDSAGQTVRHLHFHLIPRRNGDIPDPTGGVRGVIPEKMNYQKAK